MKSKTKSTGRYRIEDDTPILPHIVADGVVREVESYLGAGLPDSRKWADKLARDADRIYAANERFRKQIRARGNKGRDTLYMFMRHWLASRLKKEQRTLFERLPESFCIGLPLPGQRRR